MGVDTLRSRGPEPVHQFSVFADNKVGRLNDIIMMLAAQDIHIMSLCTVDTTDDSIIRLIVDYWEQAKNLFDERGFAYSLSEVIVVEVLTEQQIREVTCALVQAEINIHYIYPLLTRPQGKSGLVIRLEDNELAADILRQKGLQVLDHSEIAR